MHAVVPGPLRAHPPETSKENPPVLGRAAAQVLASPGLSGVVSLADMVWCFPGQPLPVFGPAGGLLRGRRR